MDRRARAVKKPKGRDGSDLTRVQIGADFARGQGARSGNGSGDDPEQIQLVTATAKQLGVDARSRIGLGNFFATACSDDWPAARARDQVLNPLETMW